MKAVLIDIGSNSIRSMTAESSSAGFVFSKKNVYTTRLAEGLDRSGALSEDSMRRSFEALAVILAEAAKAALPVYCYATSAMRDAKNGAFFVRRVKEAFALDVDVLSGEREAQLAFLGAARGIGALLDIGGGSAQIVSARLSYSAPCGCVRAKDRVPTCPPDEMRAALSPWLDDVFTPPQFQTELWTGVGGTITTLAAFDLALDSYDPGRVTDHVLTRDAMRLSLDRLYALGESRRQHPLLAARHDVILQGGTVLLSIMERCKIERLRISDADGLEGYAMAAMCECGFPK